jgi:hypothetical protein
MRRTAIGVGAAATLGGVASTSAAAIDWEQIGKYAATTVIGGPAAVGVIAYGAYFDGPDDSQVADSLAWQAHVDEYTRAREDELTLDNTVASLQRDIQLVSNKAREEAIFRVYEQGVDGGTTTTATTAAEDAINAAYTAVEKGIYDSWNLRAKRTKAVYQLFLDDVGATTEAGTAADTVGSLVGGTIEKGNDTFNATETVTTTLYDGSQKTVDAITTVYANQDPANRASSGSNLVVLKPDPADYSTTDVPLSIDDPHAVLANGTLWEGLLNDLDSEHTAMMNEVSSIVDTYFQAAQDGQYDLTDLRGPAHLTDTAQNATDYQEATMALRAMGFSISDQTVDVSFESDGETYNLPGRLARTVQDPNDLPVGSTIEPSQITGSIYGAFNITDENGDRTGEIFEITNPFTIETAEGASSVSFQNREIVESDSTLTNEEIQAIFSENYEENKKATENVYDTAIQPSSGGGGGFLSGSGDAKTLGIVAGAGALAALLFGNN